MRDWKPCCADGCENEGTLRCKACGGARYCGRACQLRDWRDAHRASCGTCARCGARGASTNERCDAKTHAEWDLRWTGSSFTGSWTSTYMCCRCDGEITRDVKDGVERHVNGPKLCVLSEPSTHCMHTKLLPPHDVPASLKEYVVSIPGEKKDRDRLGFDAQRAVDEIPEDAETIVIRSIGTHADDVHLTFPTKRYPKLQLLRIHNVEMKSLTLTSDLCPNLLALDTMNGLNACAASGALKIVAPTLRQIIMHYFDGPQRIIQDMLDAATDLKLFESYKLYIRTAPEDRECASLTFRSIDMLAVDVHRADTLGKLTLGTPRLQYLGLQACDSLDIEFPPTSVDKEVQKVFAMCGEPKLRVNVKNANIGARALATLRNHYRVDPLDLVSPEDDPETPPWMKPLDMESMMGGLRLEMQKILEENPDMPFEEVCALASQASNKKNVHPDFLKMYDQMYEDPGAVSATDDDDDDDDDDGEDDDDDEDIGSNSGESIVLEGAPLDDDDDDDDDDFVCSRRAARAARHSNLARTRARPARLLY